MIKHLFTYKNASESAKLLCDSLGIKRIKHKESKYKGGNNKFVINWGSTYLPAEVQLSRVINPLGAVHVAVSKIHTLRKLKAANVRVPPFTTNIEKAKEWVENGDEVLARTQDKARGGKGIVILEQGIKVIEAPLYVKYVPKKEEWRVHVAFGDVIDIQKKLARKDRQVKNWKIRNWNNGFIFRRHGIRPPARDVIIQAIRAVDALGLHFGGVDVIYNEREGKAYVLEVNTAPGIEGQTVESYRVAFEKFFRENG